MEQPAEAAFAAKAASLALPTSSQLTRHGGPALDPEGRDAAPGAVLGRQRPTEAAADLEHRHARAVAPLWLKFEVGNGGSAQTLRWEVL